MKPKLTLGAVTEFRVSDPEILNQAWAHHIPHAMMKERLEIELGRQS